MLENALDLKNEIDEKLMNFCLEEFKKETEIKKLKEKFNELNPIKNNIDLVDKYYRLEKENQAEIAEKVNEGSFWSSIKNINVIRGIAHKTEDNKNIFMMQNISSEIFIDKMYYVDPEKYSWEFEQFFRNETTNENL